MAKKHSATREEKEHMDKIGNMSCVLCDCLGQRQESETDVHHIRTGQGVSERADHFLTIPLCYDCHLGKEGYHGSKALLRVAKVEELDLLALTIRRLEAMK